MPYIYKDGVIYGGGGSGGGNSNVKELTYEEYLALGDAVNDDDITYFITDKEPEGGSGGNSNVKEVTLAEYEALGEATENDDITYFITDLVQEGGNGGSGGSVDVDYSQIEFDTTEILVTNVAEKEHANCLSYNSETDYFGMNVNGTWKDVVFAGFNALWIFKRNEGLQNDIKYSLHQISPTTGSASGSYSKVTLTEKSIVQTQLNNTQRQPIIFNKDLTEYIGKNKTVTVKFKFSATGADEMLLVASSSTSPHQDDVATGVKYGTISTTDEITWSVPLDNVISTSKPYIGTNWRKSGSTITFTLFDMYIS